MPSLFSNGHLLMRRLYLFWNRNVRNFAPVIQFSIRMQKAFLLLFLFLFPSSNVSTRTATPEKKVATSVPAPQKMDGEQLFEDMQLGGVVNFLAFRQAVAGYNLIKQKSKSILTLIDFTKPSTEKRLFVFDMEQKKMLYSSVVSHGKTAARTMLPLSPTKSALIKVPSASILPETLIKAETDTPFYWTGWKKESMTGPVNVPS